MWAHKDGREREDPSSSPLRLWAAHLRLHQGLTQPITGSHRPHTWPSVGTTWQCLGVEWGGGISQGGGCPWSRGLWPAGPGFLEGAGGRGGAGQATGSRDVPGCQGLQNAPGCWRANGMREGTGKSFPGPAEALPPTPDPGPLVPQLLPEPTEGQALQHGDGGQTGPSRPGLLGS